MGMVKNGCGQSCHSTLKLFVSQKWTDGINWFLACLYKFSKAKSWLDEFLVGVVTNDHGVLVHETLNSAASQEWIYELSWYFEWMLIVMQ